MKIRGLYYTLVSLLFLLLMGHSSASAPNVKDFMDRYICPKCDKETPLESHYNGYCDWCGYYINIFAEAGRKGGKKSKRGKAKKNNK